MASPVGVTDHCILYARACTMALFMDACIERPGLASCSTPRADIPREALATNTWAGYEACLCSCIKGFREDVVFHKCWLDVLRAGALAYGNAGLGSLFLLTLQGNALAYSLKHISSNSLEHVMGASRIIVEEAGVEGAIAFYEALQLASPSYMARISYLGLPSIAEGRHALEELRAGRIQLIDVLREASLYDPVSRDAYTEFSLSLGLALSILKEPLWDNRPGITEATLCLLWLLGDYLVRRKLGVATEARIREIAEHACKGAKDFMRDLKLVLGSVGPGSIADLVVNALARYYYEELLGRLTTAPL